MALLAAALLLAPALAACGDDDDSSGTSGQNGGGSSGHAGQSGQAGAGASGGGGVAGKGGGAASGSGGGLGGAGGAGHGGANGGAGGSSGGAAGSGAAGVAGSGAAGVAGSGAAGVAGSGVAGVAGSGVAGTGGAGGGTAGASPLDAIINAMPPGSWKELPDTAMAKVCPPGNHYPCDAVMYAWSGGALDDVHDRLVVFGGGHSDSPYNNVFTFDLHEGVWKRWTDLPAGMTGDTIPAVYSDKRVETCGLYPSVSSLQIPDAWLTGTGYLDPARCDDPAITPQLDPQQPRSTHSYGNVAFSAQTGRFYVLGSSALFPSGQSGSGRVMGFDFVTGQWVRGKPNPQIGYGASATDEAGRVWYLGRDSGTLVHYDPGADTWTTHGAPTQGYYYAGASVDATRHQLLLTQNGLSVTVYDLAQPDQPAQTRTTTGLGSNLSQAPGFVHLPSLDRVAAWSGGRTVRWLDPTTWAWTSMEGSGDDPGATAMNGTFGRFRYSAKRGVFVVVNESSKNVFLFRPPTAL